MMTIDDDNGTVFMVLLSLQSHCDSLPVSSYECGTAPCGCWSSDQANQLEPRVHL